MGHKDLIAVFIAINNKYVQKSSTFCVVAVDSNVSNGRFMC